MFGAVQAVAVRPFEEVTGVIEDRPQDAGYGAHGRNRGARRAMAGCGESWCGLWGSRPFRGRAATRKFAIEEEEKAWVTRACGDGSWW